MLRELGAPPLCHLLIDKTEKLNPKPYNLDWSIPLQHLDVIGHLVT
jgi:hypothetical protein